MTRLSVCPAHGLSITLTPRWNILLCQTLVGSMQLSLSGPKRSSNDKPCYSCLDKSGMAPYSFWHGTYRYGPSKTHRMARRRWYGSAHSVPSLGIPWKWGNCYEHERYWIDKSICWLPSWDSREGLNLFYDTPHIQTRVPQWHSNWLPSGWQQRQQQ